MAAENEDAWQLFIDTARRTRSEIKGQPRDFFEVDWTLVQLLLDERDIDDREETISSLIYMLKSLNG